MDTQTVYTMTIENRAQLAKLFGNRPGKIVNPEYLRASGFNPGKYMLWDEEQNKYVHCPLGTKFIITDAGYPKVVQ